MARSVGVDGFTDLALALAPMLHRTAWLLTADAHTSEDLVQETLARLYVALRGRRRIDNPGGYARTVLLRLHIDHRRRRTSTEVVTDAVPERTTTPDGATPAALWAALGTLTVEDRCVLVLRYYYDLSAAEVAEELDTTETAVRARATRATARVRALLGNDFVIDGRTP